MSLSEAFSCDGTGTTLNTSDDDERRELARDNDEKALTTTTGRQRRTDDELKNIKDRFHSHDLDSNYRKVLMYGSCNESESEEDNVYRQNVASGDRKKELKSPKPSFSLSRCPLRRELSSWPEAVNGHNSSNISAVGYMWMASSAASSSSIEVGSEMRVREMIAAAAEVNTQTTQ